MKPRHLLITLLALLTSITASAEKWTDANGTVWTFTTYGSTANISNMLANYTYSKAISGKIPANLNIPTTLYVGETPYTVTSIGNYAFKECTNITSVTIPESVTGIGSAFYNCTGLTSITIPNSVTYIGYSAFYNCSGLTSFTIPNSVKTIGDFAFNFCSGLTSVTIGSGVTSIGEGAFYKCDRLKDVYCYAEDVPDVPTISTSHDPFPLTRASATLHVPAGSLEAYRTAARWRDFGTIVAIDDSPVIDFADAKTKAVCVENWDTNGDGELTEKEADAVTDLGTAFRSNSQIKKFDELQYFTGLTSICDSAFVNCKYLADITLPQNVTSIGTRAFHACSNSLQTVSIPSEVASIGDYAFHNCYKLTSIVIPKNVTQIGNYIFYNCESLASISVESGNANYDSRGDCNAIIQTATNTLVAGCKNTVIPEDVTAIGTYAFRKATGLTSITIPQSVTSIGKYAFSACSNLTDVWCYATSVPTTGSHAFDAVPLASATLHVPFYAMNSYYATAPWSGFANIVSLDGEKSPLIDFADAKTKAVCIANWDTNGDGELSEEEAAAVTDLGTAFRNNSQIKKFDELQYFTGLTCICDSAFMNCKYLADITLPQNVTSIGTRAFHACYNSLQTVNIPSKVTSIGDYAFHNCFKLTSIVIPKKVTQIGNYIFHNCESLASISVESGNTKYNSRGNCNAIIQTATNTLIAGCKNTVIPEGVTAIGTYAFRKATGLTSITIPQSVTNIGKYAFSACSNLTDVWCYATSVPTTGSHAFDAVPFASATLHVPYPALNDYRTTAPWSDFGTIVAIEGTEPDIALSPADITVRGGQQVKLPIELNNGTDIDVVGISFTLVLPDGVSVAEDNDGDPIFTLASDRLDPNQFFVYSNQMADGSHAFRIVANSASAVVEGTEGAVMTVTLYIASGMRAGDYSIELTDNSLSVKDNGNIVRTTKLADASSTLTVSNTAGNVIMGDVNGDGDVDISDAIMVVYRSLNKPLACFNEDAADMNGDSEIDLSDAINIIYKILGLQNGSNARRRNVAAAENSDILQLNGSDNSFGMSLEGEGSYVGFQCDIKLPEGMTLASVSLSQDRAANHTVMYNRQDDGTYRIVAFSATAKAFSGNMGELMTFTTEGDEQGEVSIENIFFVNTTLQKVAFANLSAIATGISGIEETKASKGVIYDLSGKAVSNSNQQGVIIVNGKKIVNK